MSAAFQPSLMMMPRPLGSSTAFSIDSLIGSPPQPSPGHFVYTGYPMFMPYRPVVLPPPPPPPAAMPQTSLPPSHPHHHQISSLPTSFCSSLAQGMALTSTLMATLPGTFSASPQHQEAARKFAPQALQGSFDKVDAIQAEAEDGKAFLAKEGSLLAFSASEAVQASLGKYLGWQVHFRVSEMLQTVGYKTSPGRGSQSETEYGYRSSCLQVTQVISL